MYKNTILNGVPKKKIMKNQIEDKKNRIRDLSEISRGRGREGGNFKFGFGNYVTHPFPVMGVLLTLPLSLA